jgi:predicted site-specific integrase-resolvase
LEEKASILIDDLLAAEYLNLAVQTLRNWRNKGMGPPYFKLGRCVRYQLEDIEDYKQKKRVDPES